ncbi:hypothetical protein [Actinacidiphila guanduensis]|uniref:Uncharacterized protein n=1 Tax=Actinacidiphila guanduensis TaxID=310781 RepID=A0A1G9Y751_9ACTN|nr:hypothetical protein [Actinacidiphila guanduensis]SDN04909.1 hypothetical protein SAMN05216259_102439 [Actinacidiphila guanduensis]
MGAAQIPYLLGHAEVAELFGVERQTSAKWRVDGTLKPPDLVASGNPYWLLGSVLALDGKAGRRVSEERLRQYEAKIPGGRRVESPELLPVILGIQEVALVLGTTQQTVARWRHRKQIVDADLLLSRSPLWLLDTVTHDANERGRGLVAEAIERLQSGERLPQKPRGRGTATKPRPPKKPLPKPQSFTRSEQEAAVAFVTEMLSEGHTTVIRPKQ